MADHGLPERDAALLADDQDLAGFFEETAAAREEPEVGGKLDHGPRWPIA